MTCAALRLDEIDICVVATRRPGLLERTLRSFRENLFRHFSIRHVIANIDPLFGDEKDEEDCVALIRSCDPDATIRLPAQPGFAAAVAANWKASTTDVVLHLEDDWLLTHPVHPLHLQPFADYAWLGQISFNHADKRWNVRERGAFSYAQRHVKLFHHKFQYGRRKPNFLTGPSFLRGSFARGAAELMDPAFDPEKQFCRGLNPALERYAANFRNMIVGEVGDYYIQDLGRQWRRERHIDKHIVGGRSHWTQASSPLEDEAGQR